MLNDFYEKWNRLSPIGVLLIGLGLSVMGEATISKSKGKRWFIKGTIGLILTNAGVVIFGEAVKNRALYEMELNKMRKDA